MTRATDAELVRRARGGDRDAFATLVARHDPALRRACRRALHDGGLVDDAAQEAIVTALLSLHRLRDEARFGAWLVGIGLNTSRHVLRDRRGGAPAAGHDAAAPADDLHAALDAARAAARIRRAIAALPGGQRGAVELFYLAGLTHAEAAEHLGIAPGAVKARLHKARGTLRRRLEPVWKEQFAMSELVPVQVADVRRAGDRHAVILAAEDGRRLTIWVGPPEATAIAATLEGVELPRPGTHHLSAALLRAAGAAVREVRITRLVDAVFYADVVLGGGESVDARPSDGIALALVTGAPLLVEAAVLEQTAREPVDELQAEMDAARDDRRVLADETRERLARNAEELRRLSRS